MAQQDVHFDPGGGPLRVEITSGFAQQGAYSLTLARGATDRAVWRGTFEDPTDDAYALPDLAPQHDGRTLYCNAKVSVEPPIGDYAVTMTLTQDGLVIGTVAEAHQAGGGSVVAVDLFAHLKAR